MFSQPTVLLRYILYARKSSESEDRQVLSNESQVNEMRALADRDGRELVRVETEERSAKAPGRPVFTALLDAVERGEAHGIICWNPDRLSRNSVDTGRLIYLFDLGKLHEVVTPSQVFRNTPTDKFLLSLLCTQAKLDNDNKSLNVKRGLRAKAERGAYPAQAPLGYRNDVGGQKGLKALRIDRQRFPLVRRLFEYFLSGTYSVADLVRLTDDWSLSGKAGRPLSQSTVYYLLNNPVYAGTFEYPRGSGNWYRGTHRPIVSLAEFDRVQEFLGTKARHRPRRHQFTFTGIFRCAACGAAVTAEEKFKRLRDGSSRRYVYYHCTKRVRPDCPERSIEERELERQLAALLESITLPDDFHAFGVAWARADVRERDTQPDAARAAARRAHAICVKTLEGLVAMRARAELTEDEFRLQKTRLEQERLRLEERLARRPGSGVVAKVDDALSFAVQASATFAEGGRDERRRVLMRLGSNHRLRAGILMVDMKEPLRCLQKARPAILAETTRFEPTKDCIGKQKSERNYARSPAALRALNDVRTATARK